MHVLGHLGIELGAEVPNHALAASCLDRRAYLIKPALWSKVAQPEREHKQRHREALRSHWGSPVCRSFGKLRWRRSLLGGVDGKADTVFGGEPLKKGRGSICSPWSSLP